LIWLAADDPARAREEVVAAVDRWSQRGFHRQHYNALLSLAQHDLYCGDPQSAERRIVEAWPRLARSLLLRIQVLRVEAEFLRGRCAIVLATRGLRRAESIGAARRVIRRIAREAMAWSDPFAHLLRAAVASVEGDTDGARGSLLTAVDGFEQSDMGLFAAASRRGLGRLTGGEDGRRFIAAADAWMSAQNIRNPSRFSDMLAPGFVRGPDPGLEAA
jgi:hypothetical protein